MADEIEKNKDADEETAVGNNDAPAADSEVMESAAEVSPDEAVEEKAEEKIEEKKTVKIRNNMEDIEKALLKETNNFDKKFPDFNVGDTIRVYVKITEGSKERLQPYEGVVIAFKHGGLRKTFMVRRISYEVAVERIFPFHSPFIEKIELIRRGRVRRAKLYFLRGRFGKAAKIREKVNIKKK